MELFTSSYVLDLQVSAFLSFLWFLLYLLPDLIHCFEADPEHQDVFMLTTYTFLIVIPVGLLTSMSIQVAVEHDSDP